MQQGCLTRGKFAFPKMHELWDTDRYVYYQRCSINCDITHVQQCELGGEN